MDRIREQIDDLIRQLRELIMTSGRAVTYAYEQYLISRRRNPKNLRLSRFAREEYERQILNFMENLERMRNFGQEFHVEVEEEIRMYERELQEGLLELDREYQYSESDENTIGPESDSGSESS